MKKIYSALSVLTLISFGFLAMLHTEPNYPEATSIVSANPISTVANATPTSHVVEGSFTRPMTRRSAQAACDVEKRDNYSSIVVPLAKQHGLDWRLVTAIMAAESSFNPCALSPKGAMGLMQIMPAVAQDFEVDPREAYEPDQNIKAGVLLLKRLNKKYKGNLKLTVAAYNAGPGNVAKYKGIPPFKETQNYVKKVLGYHSDLKVAKITPNSGSPLRYLKAR